MLDEIKKDAKQRMQKSIESLQGQLKKLRTGRANASLLDHIKVDYYGSEVPLSQVANINVEDSRTLIVNPWEKDMVKVVDKAIMNADLGLNPSTAGTVIRVPMPPLTEERRKDMTKIVKKEGENGKIALRNIRRDALSDSKELLKEKEISEDDDRKMQDDVQKFTDVFVSKVDELIKIKETELMEFQILPNANLVIPKHIAIVMDGNGRWAKAQGKPRTFGHKKGVSVARDIVRYCGELGVSRANPCPPTALQVCLPGRQCRKHPLMRNV